MVNTRHAFLKSLKKKIKKLAVIRLNYLNFFLVLIAGVYKWAPRLWGKWDFSLPGGVSTSYQMTSSSIGVCRFRTALRIKHLYRN